jgi:2-keto-4-pentenoate hydratase
MDRAQEAARWLAEAWETGNPLAPLPPEIAPRDSAEGEETAFALLDALGLHPCGVRVAPGPGGALLAAPMLETRLLKSPAAIAVPALRHAAASAALVAVLAEPLGEGPPRLAALHPALDVAASRFTAGPADAAAALADCGGLGLVVAGRAGPAGVRPQRVALGAPTDRVRGAAFDLDAALAPAVAAARRMGGLPAGALLVVAGLTPAVPPRAGESLAARFGRFGRAEAAFAES